ncbi:MAG: hypothetical protein A3E57_00300 [Candidatus Muproteobacteria bacterium RIFCSPHIGHO2_12_FULL_60_33]|uniref:MalT-like TPR region domain-containing protein n=1 Tax=Candidatus Muproteobacteria bacterium RIFCSPLOWO2_01_FULL_60_18 TaxID=1817768 RepID=A0A1F6U5P1_9PROT|nr:MAG: hypothetical protein A3A87_10275 [Candidatus Muproteobacteria bacterium RIFCSPLOWO2_01_FULL_60_18]OGI53776.1 MAG: hypothetical protein A3D32_06680 [Candidatus Muproteobacteria bacterium RIFCSPHIGHO2_02_FULL_60_13]OGI55424.1 MAG: hypothetical protein A3E57_00300 [Candidatus Muproteobacteria bacterium RIFCSPHIGHO2_12_FULL_60_33]OGI59256.1 MAG: hypothetical protein A2809_05175 [Candidatus Muproteobacteria bacterium RIFCSPHIGHO2_01_FULL_61_200]
MSLTLLNPGRFGRKILSAADYWKSFGVLLLYSLRNRRCHARMSLSANPQETLSLARRVLALNKNVGDKAEEANSLRLMVDASFAAGDFKIAQQFYGDTLVLDKESGSAAKIALDLMGLGRSLAQQGKRAEAVDYFQRAYSVWRSMGSDSIE